MKVVCYQYDWKTGAQEQDRHFKVIMSADEEAVKLAWNEDFYSKTGQFDHGGTDHRGACDAAFEKFQDIRGIRSLSVGDIVKVDTKYYIVKPLGFAKIDLE